MVKTTTLLTNIVSLSPLCSLSPPPLPPLLLHPPQSILAKKRRRARMGLLVCFYILDKDKSNLLEPNEFVSFLQVKRRKRRKEGKEGKEKKEGGFL